MEPEITFQPTKKLEEFVILGNELLDKTSPPLIFGDNILIRSHSVIYAGVEDWK